MQRHNLNSINILQLYTKIAAIIRQEVQPIKTTIENFDTRLKEVSGKFDGRFGEVESHMEDIDIRLTNLENTCEHTSGSPASPAMLILRSGATSRPCRWRSKDKEKEERQDTMVV